MSANSDGRPDDDDVMTTAAPLPPNPSRPRTARPPSRALPPTDVNVWRAGLARSRGGRALLDALITPHDASRLVQALPVDDLHGYLHRIGLGDADGVLALTNREQVQGLLDTDIWARDSLELERLDPWLNALMRAGPKVLFERLTGLDDSLLSWTIRRSVRTIVVEDPDDFEAPDVEHVVTPDGRLCICFPESAPRDLPVKLFLDTLMRDDPAMCINLLVAAEAALDSNLQEQAYRWRTGRMADRGYVDYYDALRIYTAPRADQVQDAREALPQESPLVERWLVPILSPDARLVDAFSALEAEHLDVLQAALGFAANMALSADRVELWDEEAQKTTLDRLRAGLVLGLDVLAGPSANAQRDAEVLSKTPLNLVFRTGYARMLDAAKPVRQAAHDGLLAGADDRVGGVDLEQLAGWAKALTERHPRHVDGRPLGSTAELRAASIMAGHIAELARVAGPDRPAAYGVGAWLITWMTRDLIGLDGPGALPGDQLERAHRALFQHGRFNREALPLARHWWSRAGGQRAESLSLLVAAAAESMAGVDAEDLEPRFLPLWVIEG